MIKATIRIIALIALIIGSYIYGIFTYKNHIFPYNMLEAMKSLIWTPESTKDLKIKKEKYFKAELNHYRKTKVEDLISIRTSDDIYEARRKLIHLFWGERGIPSDKLPIYIRSQIRGPEFKAISSLARIDKLIVKMAFGLESHIFHLLPKNKNGKVILFHQGHTGYYIKQVSVKKLLDNGYSVVALCMPLRCQNNKPTVFFPRLGHLRITTHDQMKFFKTKSGHPIKYFIEPVIVILNYLQKNFDYRHIAMLGISGGGWTTTIAAAIDKRIKTSIPVAGSYPIYLRSESTNDWGDWEQTAVELYNAANYFELYLLGGYGVGREQIQVINKYDPCCFRGIKWQAYKDIIRLRIQELGPGNWDLFLDDTHHTHQISDVSLKMILSNLKNK